MTRTIVRTQLPFGWCLDGNHERCRITYTTVTGLERRCVCPCHQ